MAENNNNSNNANNSDNKSGNRDELYEKAKQLNENENYNEAMEILKEIIEMNNEVSNSEMELINWVVFGLITSAAFGDEKKGACYGALEILEPIKICKNAEWLENYESSIYECFSKLNSCVRDEERENVWCRLKEFYLDIFKTARRIWNEKNIPERLNMYLNLSKLSKFYLDVADLETLSICEEAAKEAKFVGRGTLNDDQFQDTNKLINDIKKNIVDAEHGKEQFQS